MVISVVLIKFEITNTTHVHPPTDTAISLIAYALWLLKMCLRLVMEPVSISAVVTTHISFQLANIFKNIFNPMGTFYKLWFNLH